MVYMSSPASSLPTLPQCSPRRSSDTTTCPLYPEELVQSDGENADDELDEDSEMESIGCPEDSDDEIDDGIYDKLDDESDDESGDEIDDGIETDEDMNGEGEIYNISFGRVQNI